MITSNDCWLKDGCKKFIEKSDCECRHGDIFCVKLFKINELYNNSLMESSQKKRKTLVLDADKCDKEAYLQLKDFCSNIKDNVERGENLYIYSSITGNGKTAWAEKICQAYINTIWYDSDLSCRVLFISVPRFLISMKSNIEEFSNYYNHIKNNVFQADLVVWDDIATKDTTQFEHENLLSIIDARIAANKSNIFTSNVSPENLESLMGARLSSRIVGYSKCIQFVGKDKRGVSL